MGSLVEAQLPPGILVIDSLRSKAGVNHSCCPEMQLQGDGRGRNRFYFSARVFRLMPGKAGHALLIFTFFCQWFIPS